MINRMLMCIMTAVIAPVTVVTLTILLIVLVIPLWYHPKRSKKEVLTCGVQTRCRCCAVSDFTGAPAVCCTPCCRWFFPQCLNCLWQPKKL